MKNISNENILEELQNLKVEERIFIPINEDISNTIQLLSLKCSSYENLFKSYINSTCEEANVMNVDAFLQRYREAYTQIDLYKQATLKANLGDEAYKYLFSGNFAYNFDYRLNILSIFIPSVNTSKMGCCK